MNRRALGTKEEGLAAEYLEKQGYRILERNFRNRKGEIDLIAEEQEYLVFVEVKYRKDKNTGLPEEAVDYRKQRIISQVAMFYLLKHGKSMDTPCRFDVVAIEGEEIRLYRNAFDFQGW